MDSFQIALTVSGIILGFISSAALALASWIFKRTVDLTTELAVLRTQHDATSTLFSRLDARLESREAKLDARFDKFERELDTAISDMRTTLKGCPHHHHLDAKPHLPV